MTRLAGQDKDYFVAKFMYLVQDEARKGGNNEENQDKAKKLNATSRPVSITTKDASTFKQ